MVFLQGVGHGERNQRREILRVLSAHTKRPEDSIRRSHPGRPVSGDAREAKTKMHNSLRLHNAKSRIN